MLQHFICQQCKDLPSIISKFDELWTRKFDYLYHKVEEMNHLSTKKILQNDEAFTDISGQLHSFSKSLIEIEKLQKNTSKINLEKSIFNELSSSNSKSIGSQTDPPKTTSTLSTTQSASSSTSGSNSNKAEWRVIGEKKIWKADWNFYDNHMDKKNKVKPTKTAISNKLKKKNPNLKNVENRQNYNSFDNFYQILEQFDHTEPPVHQLNTRKNTKPPQLNQKFRKQSPLPQSNPAPVPAYSNFIRGPIINQYPQQPLQQPHCFSPPSSTSSTIIYSQPPTTANSGFYTTNAATYSISTDPVTTQAPTSTIPNNQSPISFMDPLIPAVVKNTMMSAQQNGRYVLARLRDKQLLKTVRLYLSYFHENPNACYDGLTGPHCKILIGTSGLPTDFAALKSIYTQFHTTFGLTEKQINADLKTLRNHISSNRINHIQRSKENFNKFNNFF
jgi:hypothetical protein